MHVKSCAATNETNKLGKKKIKLISGENFVIDLP